VRTIHDSVSGRGGWLGSENIALILRCGRTDGHIATDLFGQKTQFVQDPPRRLEKAESEVKTAADSWFFAEFVGPLEGKRPEVNARNVGELRTLCFRFGFEELLSALEAFDAAPLHESLSSIHNKSSRGVRDVEERNPQPERDVNFLQQELGELRGANSRLSAKNRVQKQEKDALHKRSDELVALLAQAPLKSDDVTKHILQEFQAVR
jgi:hypothetical protein